MKPKISVPTDEQELHINFSPTQPDKMCEVYTTIPWAMKQLEKLVNKFPNECKLVKDDKYGYTAMIPFKLVKPRSPRVMTDEQKQAARDRMLNIRK